MLKFGPGRRMLGGTTVIQSGTPTITCAFPLAYSGLEGLGPLPPDTISADGQTITQSLAAGSNQWSAASLTQTVPSDSGVTVVRLGVGSLPAMAADGSEGGCAVDLSLYQSTSAKVGVRVTSSAGAFSWQVLVNGSAVATGALSPLPAFIDIRLNAGAATFDVELPDSTVLLANEPYTPAALNPLMSIIGSGVALGGIGRSVSCSFVTAATTLANSPFAGGGAVDACGNTI